MFRFARPICLFLALALALPAMAEPLIPERRAVVSRNTDFPGNDLRSIFDTTLTACDRACRTDPLCTAFTFNERAGACFPKSGVETPIDFSGATSVRLLTHGPAAETLAATRAVALPELGERDLEAAYGLAARLGYRHAADGWTAGDLLTSAVAARGRGDTAGAYRLVGAATTLTDAPDHWTEYARLAVALAEAASDGSTRRTYGETGIEAAVNGYLRAADDATAATALVVLSEAFETMRRGREMIPVLRLAQDLSPRDEISDRLDAAIGKYGFRVVDTRVESDSAAPRICAVFNERLVQEGVDYDPFVQREVTGLTVVVDDAQLCIDGVEHGVRYRFTLRAGLPAESGETLVKPVELTHYVRDRSPSVRFPGRAYVLPKGGPATLPLVSVNAETVDLALRRVSDRNLIRAVQQNFFGRSLAEYEDDLFASEIAEEIWTGSADMEVTLNQDVTTRLPVDEMMGDLPPGIYALSASIPGADPYETPAATQWFIISDLGLATMEGVDGLHVVLRSLASAEAVAGAEVTLLSRANAVLATAETDAQGYARFEAAATRGRDGAAPALVMVRQGEEDLTFLSLTDPAFDLSDRGVEGRPPAPPIDVFLATDRGAYRAGETIYLTALTRDGEAEALTGLPLTAVLERPDGVEYSRTVSNASQAGGHVFALPVGPTAPRGTWTIRTYVDPDAPALATQQVLVEDFLPERIDVDLSLPVAPLDRTASPVLGIEARYLFGAPAGDLAVEGEVRVRATRTLPGWGGYVFGRYDEVPQTVGDVLPGGIRTDGEGQAQVALILPSVETEGHPLEAEVVVRVSEGSGRPVERAITRALVPDRALIGIRQLFDSLPEGAEASFTLAAVGAEGTAMPAQVRWTLNRVERSYQWYSLYGNWNWEPITRRSRIATGEVTLDGPTEVTAPVEWGRYELVVERVDGSYTVSSTDFYAGWYAPADAASTPDTLELSLDKPAYAPGETATLRVVPRSAGVAVVSVLSNRLIDMRIVDVTEGSSEIALPVTEDWGPGAYVTASVIRPVEGAEGRAPTRALGLSYARVDPGARRLAVAFEAPAEADPRGPLEVALAVDGVAAGETAWATIAAVDVGILNLTGFESPDPEGHYFGQRRLGVGLRDLYGRLIDPGSGAMGRIRSGGDREAGMRRQADPPTEELVAYFAGPVEVGADGRARANFDLPSFNGTVRLMAVAWSESAIGQAEADVLVRDPVVVTASVPRFLAPGDTARVLLELTHATGPTGRVGLDVTGNGVTLGAAPSGIDLAEGGQARITVPVTASEPGLATIEIRATTPGGKLLTKTLNLPVRANDPEIARRARVTLAAGQTFTFDEDVFADFRPGTTTATLAAGPLARFDAPGLLTALDRYPYGCTEQVTSQAMPLLYFDQVAEAMDLGTRDDIAERIEQSVRRVLTNQSASGGFGLWRPSSGDFWLDAYVTDFLGRARAQGYDVPDTPFRAALDNLRNRINYAPDFDEGGQDIAYALYVLAREGAAAMGDLRYYADVKAEAFATPLAQAQLGAALAAYGDQTRADLMFAAAAQRIGAEAETEAQYWRVDYGTPLRDAAAILALATEARSEAVNRALLTERIARTTGRRSTQEAAWTLLAANALIADFGGSGVSVNGTPVTGPLVRVLEDPGTVAVENTAAQDTIVTLTTFGVPAVPERAGGNGYAIKREYYSLEGAPVSPETVTVGTRLVTVLTVTPFERGQARLMVADHLPAGWEIDNPNLLRAGDIRALDWLEAETDVATTEAREDRFLAALDRRSDAAFRLAYIVRAVSPGTFHHPAALVEDMYRPEFRAISDTGRVTVTE